MNEYSWKLFLMITCFEILPWYVISVQLHTVIVNDNTKQAVVVSQWWLTTTFSSTWRPASPVGLGSHAIAWLVCIDCGEHEFNVTVAHATSVLSRQPECVHSHEKTLFEAWERRVAEMARVGSWERRVGTAFPSTLTMHWQQRSCPTDLR